MDVVKHVPQNPSSIFRAKFLLSVGFSEAVSFDKSDVPTKKL